MKTKYIYVLAGTVLIATFSSFFMPYLHAGQPGYQQQLVFDVEATPQIIVPDPGYLLVVEYDLWSPSGKSAGKAIGRFTEVSSGTKPFSGRELRADFTFDLAEGQIEASITIREFALPSGTTGDAGPAVLQLVQGTVMAGEGSYQGAHGIVHGGGTSEFTPIGLANGRLFISLK